MGNTARNSLIDLNMYVNQIRGNWVILLKKYNVNYHEMLVLYHIYNNGESSQREICENYLLPKQTVNNIVTAFKNNDYIAANFADGNRKEKLLSLTEKGNQYVENLVVSMQQIEEELKAKLGEENIVVLQGLLKDYGDVIKNNAYEA